MKKNSSDIMCDNEKQNGLSKIKASIFITLGSVFGGAGFAVFFSNCKKLEWSCIEGSVPFLTNGIGMMVIGLILIVVSYYWIRGKINTKT